MPKGSISAPSLPAFAILCHFNSSYHSVCEVSSVLNHASDLQMWHKMLGAKWPTRTIRMSIVLTKIDAKSKIGILPLIK